MVEERFFRGFLQPRVGIGVSTLLFVLAHLSYDQPFLLVGVSILSLVFAALVWWRQNVWPAIAAHFLFDAVQLLILIPWVLHQWPGGSKALGPLAGGCSRRGAGCRGELDGWTLGLRRRRASLLLSAHSMPVVEPEAYLAVASRFENIELVQAVVEDLLQRLEMGEDDRHWIGLAMREAVANAIKHGNGGDPQSR